MGVVFRACQRKLNRTVALKMILSWQLADQEEVRRFQAEAEAAAQLDHPGIVPIYEIGEQDGQHYFSMAFVDGESLQKHLSGGPLAPREAASLCCKIAEAVAYAHSKGVIHRDLKPANVILDAKGEPRVTDFGLAKQIEAGSGLTRTGAVIGTPSYMPPEQAAGKTNDIGTGADVYSLGAILYCLLTGRPPFQASSSIDVLRQVLEQEPVQPRQLNAKLPLDLNTICLKCLDKQVTSRYDSTQDLCDDLQRYLRGETIQARPVGRLIKTWRWCRREPVLATLLSVVFVSAFLMFVANTGWAVINVAGGAGRAFYKPKQVVNDFKQLNLAIRNYEASMNRAIRNYEANKYQLDKSTVEEIYQLFFGDPDLTNQRPSPVRISLAEILQRHYRDVIQASAENSDTWQQDLRSAPPTGET